MNKFLTILLTLSLSSLCATAATIRVPADQPTIQAGIDAAVDGDTVLLADGRYTGTGNRGVLFHGKAITLRSENGPETCIVDGEFAEEWFEDEVLSFSENEGRNTVVDGLTITGGYTWGISIGDAALQPSPIIRNCIVSGNNRGLYLGSGCPLVETTRVVANFGKGIYSSGRSHIADCVITDNGDVGIDCYGSGRLVENCLISGNGSDGLGGGVQSEWGESLFRNCTIVGNSAESGGGLFIWREGSIILENCIVAGNSASDLGNQCALIVDYYSSYTYAASLTLNYSDVHGEIHVDPWCDLYTGPGVIDQDPLFVPGPLGGFYLSQVAAGQGTDSPCVDTGDPSAEMVHGTTRTDSAQDAGIVDMGYHYRDPDEGPLPETIITGGPDCCDGTTIPAIVYTFTGRDEDYPPSALTYSWRLNDEPWSDWSSRSWVAIGELESFTQHLFEVRVRDPEGDIDPIPAERFIYFSDNWPEERYDRLAVGPGPGPFNPPIVRTSLNQWPAYSVMRYGVNLAAGNVDGDGPDELITGPGPGAMFGPHVRCFRGDGTVIKGAGFLAYGTNKYGVNVAAGDVEGDGYDEIITGAGPGAVFGPHVRGWNWDGGPAVQPMNGISFFAYGTLRWGVNVACGDIDGDGRDEIITGAGPGAVFGPHVRGWSYDNGQTAPMGGISFFAYNTPQWGVNVACGDLNGDGIDEIVTGAGPGPAFAPHVRAWRYDGTTIFRMAHVDYTAYEDLRFGVVVSAADVDGDGRDEILTMPGPGPSNQAWLRAWDVESGTVSLASSPWDWLFLDEWLTHGGHVAGSKNGWE